MRDINSTPLYAKFKSAALNNKQAVFELKQQYEMRNQYSSMRISRDTWYVRFLQRLPISSNLPQFDRVYRIKLMESKYLVCETCQMYAWMGIPCRHVIHILNSIDFDAKYIPIQYHRNYVVYGDNPKHSLISGKINIVGKLKFPGPRLCDEKINDGKECPYHWLGPKKEIEWYNELIYSNIPVVSNYDMQQLKKLFIKTETGLLSSRGNTFFSLSQETHGVNCTDDDDNNDDDVHAVFQNVTSDTSSNAYTRLKMHFSHICTMCDNNEDAIKFVEEKLKTYLLVFVGIS
jgi:hypothetical protein